MGPVLEVGENQLTIAVGADRMVFSVASDTMILVQNVESSLSEVKPGFMAMVMAVNQNGARTATMIDAHPEH